MKQDNFIQELKKLNIQLTETQLSQLEIYYEMIVEYNKIMNLTGITEHDEVFLKHFYDSLTIVKIIDLNTVESFCDIGTGAGFPGLVIKICFPKLKVTLLDSLNKRVEFLKAVIQKLNLKDIEVVHARAEEYALSHRSEFDVTTARAVAHTSILLEYAIPMTKVEKYFIAMKANVEEEVKEIDNALKKLSTKLIQKEEFLLPLENSKRTILLFKKEKENKHFPRKNNEIKKNRL
ncbi:MAG: 16S rRNA (guanine(527)-N(7))-methyltransferase RsmG [Tenericutes bacterium]|nr:16S rRNA (guanine(527)-N(7))-methyltransferase RsmG [Mycoplasmatota bacterium]